MKFMASTKSFYTQELPILDLAFYNSFLGQYFDLRIVELLNTSNMSWLEGLIDTIVLHLILQVPFLK